MEQVRLKNETTRGAWCGRLSMDEVGEGCSLSACGVALNFFQFFVVDVVLTGSHVALSCSYLENRLQTLSCSPDTLPHLPALQFGG